MPILIKVVWILLLPILGGLLMRVYQLGGAPFQKQQGFQIGLGIGALLCALWSIGLWILNSYYYP